MEKPNPHPGSIDVRQNWASGVRTVAAGEFSTTYSGVRYRAIRWKPEWPAPDDVPQEGAIVYADGEPYTVQTGVPTVSGPVDELDVNAYGLDLFDVNGNADWYPFEEISLTPPAPPRAEGEVVGALVSRNGFLSVDWEDGTRPTPDGVYLVVRRDS